MLRCSKLLACAAVALAGVPTSPPVSQDGVSITFLANEGVLLSSGGKHVLIDALFQKYETGYAVPADSTRAALERATGGRFGRPDPRHAPHGDHFHPASVVAHLRANPRATLLTSAQVIDSLRGRLPVGHQLAPRLLARTAAARSRRREVVNGIAVELLGLPHGGARHRSVEHLGYIVELGGRRVLHVGDTEVSEAAFASFRLDTARIDVALLPQWMVTSAAGRR